MTVFDEFRRILNKHKDIMPIVAVAEMLADIDEAEAKWNDGWIPCSEQMPPKEDGLLLVQCSGKPRKNAVLHNAFELAIFDGTGWYFPMYPVWDDADVIAWQPLPAIYEKGQ